MVTAGRMTVENYKKLSQNLKRALSLNGAQFFPERNSFRVECDAGSVQTVKFILADLLQ